MYPPIQRERNVRNFKISTAIIAAQDQHFPELLTLISSNADQTGRIVYRALNVEKTHHPMRQIDSKLL